MQGRWLLTAFCLVIAVMLLFPVSLLAAGVGVAPKELEFNAYPGSSASETLYVINTGDNEAEYRVYSEVKYKNWFDIAPNEFTLAPNEVKEVRITVSPPLLSVGDHAAYIYVATTNPSPQLGVGAGIKVPVHLHIASWPLYVAIGMVALLAALAAFLVWRRSRAY
jgi:P pilus assembly chaperone PapD